MGDMSHVRKIQTGKKGGKVAVRQRAGIDLAVWNRAI